MWAATYLGCVHTQLRGKVKSLASKTFTLKYNKNMRLYQPGFTIKSDTFAMCKLYQVVKPRLKFQLPKPSKLEDSRFENWLQSKISVKALD